MSIEKIPFELQLDIFEKIFFFYLEIPSMRWKIKSMIEKYDDVDFAELDLKLEKEVFNV